MLRIEGSLVDSMDVRFVRMEMSVCKMCADKQRCWSDRRGNPIFLWPKSVLPFFGKMFEYLLEAVVMKMHLLYLSFSYWGKTLKCARIPICFKNILSTPCFLIASVGAKAFY